MAIWVTTTPSISYSPSKFGSDKSTTDLMPFGTSTTAAKARAPNEEWKDPAVTDSFGFGLGSGSLNGTAHADGHTHTDDDGVSERPKSATDAKSTANQPPNIDKRDALALLVRKLLLGEELVNTQFHLFSAKSPSSRQVIKPRVLCANNALLTQSSKYFLDLLSSDINPADASLSELMGDNDIPQSARMDDYGYESDSDLDECDDPIPEVPGDQAATPSKVHEKTGLKNDDGLSDGGSESVTSDMFVLSPEEPRAAEPLPVVKDEARSVASSATVAGESRSDGMLTNQTTKRLRSLESRHVLVKDTAFQTWYSLLNYLSTSKVRFLPLSSATPGGKPRISSSSTSLLDEPKCSAKSMYRLACKLGLDSLRDKALAHIQRNLTKHNILEEITCSLLSSHPQLLEMELDVLYSHITSSPVVDDFPAFVKRIIDKKLPHGADIILKVHAKSLEELRLLRSTGTPTKILSPSSSVLSSFLNPPPSLISSKPPLPVAEDLGKADQRLSKRRGS